MLDKVELSQQFLASSDLENAAALWRNKNEFLKSVATIFGETWKLKILNPALSAIIFPRALEYAESKFAAPAILGTATLILVADEIMEAKSPDYVKESRLQRVLYNYTKKFFEIPLDDLMLNRMFEIVNKDKYVDISFLNTSTQDHNLSFKEFFICKFLEVVNAMRMERNVMLPFAAYKNAANASHGFPLVALMHAYRTGEDRRIHEIYPMIELMNQIQRGLVDMRISADDIKTGQNVVYRHFLSSINIENRQTFIVDFARKMYCRDVLNDEIEQLHKIAAENSFTSLKTFKFSLSVLKQLQILIGNKYNLDNMVAV